MPRYIEILLYLFVVTYYFNFNLFILPIFYTTIFYTSLKADESRIVFPKNTTNLEKIIVYTFNDG